MKATPGPWSAEQNPLDPNCIVIRSADGFAIASAWNLGDLQIPISANARLVAASPDLLEALESFARWAIRANVINEPEDEEVMAKAQTAIAKARGE